MATRSLATNLSAPAPTGLREEDYRTFSAALESTQRGRDFLAEYGRRNRNADTEMLLDSLDRIETMMKAEGKARDRLQDELRVLLIAIRLARPDINSATALTKAARLVDLLDLMETRLDAMVENKDLTPVEEEPLPASQLTAASLSVVPRPDEPELPIPSVTTLPTPALVPEPTRVVIKPLVTDVSKPELAIQEIAKQEIAKEEIPEQDAPQALEARKVEAPKVEALQVEAPKVEAPKVEAPKAEPSKQALIKPQPVTQELQPHEWAQLEIINRPRPKTNTPAETYELWDEPVAQAAPAPFVTEAAPAPLVTEAAPVTRMPAVTQAVPVPALAEAVLPPPEAAAPEIPAPVAAPDKWLPDFGGEEQIIHTKPVTAAAFMPEVTFMAAASRPAVVESKMEAAVIDVAVATVVTAASGSIADPVRQPQPPATAKAVPPRNDPLAAIMSLSEAERIALFT